MPKADKARYAKLAFVDEERLTAGLTQHRAPAWSRDGRLVAFSVGDDRDASFAVVDRHGRLARTLDGPAVGAATFAPNGGVAFERRFGTASEIWLTPGGDAPPVRLLGGDGRLYRDPVFSPDGNTLACAVADQPTGNTHLHLVKLENGRHLIVTADLERADRRPAFCPSGEELVFEAARNGDHALFSLHLVRNELSRLTPEGELARRPAIIDESLLVYERAAAHGPSVLVLLDRTRGITRVITDDDVHRCDPACFVTDSGKVRIAFAAQSVSKPGAAEPPRFDIFVARLRGLGLEAPAAHPASELSL